MNRNTATSTLRKRPVRGFTADSGSARNARIRRGHRQPDTPSQLGQVEPRGVCAELARGQRLLRRKECPSLSSARCAPRSGRSGRRRSSAWPGDALVAAAIEQHEKAIAVICQLGVAALGHHHTLALILNVVHEDVGDLAQVGADFLHEENTLAVLRFLEHARRNRRHVVPILELMAILLGLADGPGREVQAQQRRRSARSAPRTPAPAGTRPAARGRSSARPPSRSRDRRASRSAARTGTA